MLSLRQLLDEHAPVLVVDAASAAVQVGWLNSASHMQWCSSSDEAGVAIFEGVQKLGRSPSEAASFLFCDGPGSILGIRTAAMALRSWSVLSARPIFAYHSLALVVHALARADVTVIADARRELWHAAKLGGLIARKPAAELVGELVMPEGFRNWSALPAGVSTTPYALSAIFPRVVDAPVLRSVSAPDAFMHEEPSYVTWTPKIHRAP